jgi:glycosyltransferase involved in cell wall biosynthesis
MAADPRQPLVSIIIPCLNSERTLGATLASCLAQTWPSIEIIVVDNGSSDGSMALADALAQAAHYPLSVLHHPERGANRARQAGFQVARGDYIRWLDADDQLASNVTEKQVHALEADHRYDIAYCDWLWRQHLGHVPTQHELLHMAGSHTAVAYGDRRWQHSSTDPMHAEARFKLEQDDDFLLRLLEDKWLPPHAYLLRRGSAQQLMALQAFHPDRSVAQDREFFTFAALLGLRFLYVPDTQVFYNSGSSGQITQQTSARERACQLAKVFSRLRTFAERKDGPRLGRHHQMYLGLPWERFRIAPDADEAKHEGPGRYRVRRQGGANTWIGRDEARIYQCLRRIPGPGTMEQLAKTIQHTEYALWERQTEVIRALLRFRELDLLCVMTPDDTASTELRADLGPRVLMVTDVPFWAPGRGDSARIRALVQFLRKQLDLDLFVIVNRPGKAPTLSRVTLPLGSETCSAWLAATPEPGVIPAMLAEVAKRSPLKACLFEYLRLKALRKALPAGVLSLLDTHDLVNERARSFKSFGVEPPRELTAAAEYAAFRDFDGVVLIQEDDYATVSRHLGRERCLLAPHPVEMPRTTIRPHARHVSFVGSESAPNIDGLRWFLAEVWSTVAAPGAHLHVYGRVGEKVDTAAHTNVTVHGLVADLPGLYQASDLVINPVRFGSGLKIKTVEAIASGLPLVTTTEGARGLAPHAGRAFLVADDAKAFHEHLEALLTSLELRCTLSEAAWQLGRERFTPSACFQSLLDRIRRP